MRNNMLNYRVFVSVKVTIFYFFLVFIIFHFLSSVNFIAYALAPFITMYKIFCLLSL